MLNNIEVLCHSSIRITKEKIIYIDPYKIEKNYQDADYIFITHNHYDHFSPKDLEKISNEFTKIIVPASMKQEIESLNLKNENIFTVIPNEKYKIDDLEFETIPSYNTTSSFHPKDNNWVGYILILNDTRYYFAGDTDITFENKKVICDIAFLPIGGVYTMNYEQASQLADIIKPKVVVPIHYGCIVGTKEDAFKFKKLINKEITCQILIK